MIGKCNIIRPNKIKDTMEELWKLVQDKERIIESQRDEIDRLKAEVRQLRQVCNFIIDLVTACV